MNIVTWTGNGLFAAALALASTGGAAAADLPTAKEAPAPLLTEAPLDIHGFVDIGVGSDFVTARGSYLIKGMAVTAIDNGLILDVYKNKTGFINKVSVYAGTYFQLSNGYHPATSGSFSEFDWWTGATVSFANNWAFDAQYYSIVSPEGLWVDQQNLQFTLSYDDTSWGLPIQFKPYVLGWYQMAGSPNTGGKNQSGYVQLGSNLTWDLTKKYGVKFIAPTYISFGPSDYWKSSGCGLLSTSPCSASSAGLFSTGLTAVVPVTWVPKNYGSWSVKAGFQYYHLINDGLLAQQVAFDGPGSGVVPTYGDAKRDIVVAFGGVGFTF